MSESQATPITTPLRIAVLASGNGSNLQVLIDAMTAGDLPIEIVGVISNREDAYAIERARTADIPVAILSHAPSGKRMAIKTFEAHASQQLDSWQPDLIVLAGFMRVLSREFIAGSIAPMINLHPSLLPVYKGLDTHTRVIRAGDRQHGCSVHVVTAELDAGQVLTQAVLSVLPTDTPEHLQKRVQVLEHKLLPWTILLLATGVLSIATNQHTDKKSCLPALPLRLML